MKVCSFGGCGVKSWCWEVLVGLILAVNFVEWNRGSWRVSWLCWVLDGVGLVRVRVFGERHGEVVRVCVLDQHFSGRGCGDVAGCCGSWVGGIF